MIVFVMVFVIGGALFFGLRYWDKRSRAQRVALPVTSEVVDDALADNLDFAADVALRMGKRFKGGDRSEDGAGDSSADGGGGDGG
jgi:hypothetical protein